MNFHRLDLNLLVALDALLHERHVGRAAERMHVSQPTMSVALAKLRDYYRDELLVRDGRQMALTAFADQLRPRLSQLIADIAPLARPGPEIDLSKSDRRFVLVINSALARIYLPGLLRRMKEAAPLTTLTCLDVTDATIDRFNAGDADVVMMPTGAWLAGGDRSWMDRQPNELLFEDFPVCIAWTGNDAVGESLTLEQVQSFGHVISSFSAADFRAPSERPLSQFFGASLRVEAEVPMTAVAPMIVGTGLVSILSNRLARYEARRHALKLSTLPPELRSMRAIHMFWTRKAHGDAGTQWLRGLLREEAKNPQSLLSD